jgi:hypothetical protein
MEWQTPRFATCQSQASTWNIMTQSPVIYEIQVEGNLDSRWSEWFGGMDMMQVETEKGLTIMTGPMQDQAALHGLLGKVRDLGLVLVSVRRVGDEMNSSK